MGNPAISFVVFGTELKFILVMYCMHLVSVTCMAAYTALTAFKTCTNTYCVFSAPVP